MINEYILHEVECLACDGSMRELMMSMMNGHSPTEFSDCSFLEAFGPDFLTSQNLAKPYEDYTVEGNNLSTIK